jgi:hypothetical protein
MGSLFLFISLAVLVGIVGLLAYYFKSRLAEVESKNLKSLEIIEGMYSQQQQMKQYILSGGAAQAHAQAPTPVQASYKHSDQYDERIKIVLDEESDDESEDESDDESEDESELDSDSESESDGEVKKVTVDMSFPEECDLDIEEDDNEYIPEDEPEVNLDEPNVQSEEDAIVVNKLSADDDKVDEDFEITAVKSNEKDNYKKMSIAALKNILHSRGIVTDSARLNKMKKSEIIDLLLVASLAQ